MACRSNINKEIKLFKLTRLFFKFNSTDNHSVKIETPSDYKIELNHTNFRTPLGTKTVRQSSFAIKSKYKMFYINFYVFSVGKTNPTMHYALYKGM